MRVFRREPLLGLITLILVLLLLSFVVIPLAQVVIAPGASGYATVLTENGSWPGAIRNSVIVTVLSTTSAVVLGFIYAYAMVYADVPWKGFFRTLALLPLLSPPFVVAFSYILLFGPRGIVTYGLLGQSPNILGLGGLWGVQTIAFFPYAYQLIADVLSRSEPRLEQAAHNLGAGPWRVFWTVTLPLSRPGLLAAVLLVAIYVLEDFGNPALIAGQYTVLPTLAYGLISGFGDFAGAAVVSTILLLMASLLYVIRLRLQGDRSYVTVGGRGSMVQRPPVPRVVTRVLFVLCLLLALLILMVYGVLILSAVVRAFPFNMAATTLHFEYVGQHATSLRNSLVYASSAAVVCAFLAIVLAFIIHRKSWTGKGAVDFLTLIPAAVPGIFFGIGYALTFNQPYLDWLDRGLLIVISMVFWNLPVGYQAASAALAQIDRSLDDAAAILGAGSLRTLRDVFFPLLRGAFITGLTTAFVRAITTLSVLIFLFTPGTTVATITIFQLVNDFNWGGAAAFTVSVIGLAVAVLVTLSLVSGRQVRLREIATGG